MDGNETIADIVAEMRGIYIREWQDLADRIEAAANRESELLKANIVRVRELEGMLGGAANTLLGCAIRQKKSEAEAEKRETVTNCNGLGNASKLREALSAAGRAAREIQNVTEEADTAEVAISIAEICDRSLLFQPRNCDVGDENEQANRFSEFCNGYAYCTPCPVHDKWDFNKAKHPSCALCWGQMPYDAAQEGGVA